MDSNFGSLYLYSFLSIIQIILLCAAGCITPPVRQALSKMVFYVLLPAITFVKVTPAVSAGLLAHWWPIAVNVVLSVGGGLGLGALIALATRTPAHLRRHMTWPSAWGKLIQLPLMLVTSVCADPKLLFAGALGGRCADQGITYVVVGMAVASVIHYAVFYHLFKPRPELEPGAVLPVTAPPPSPAEKAAKGAALDTRRSDSAADLTAMAVLGKSAHSRAQLAMAQGFTSVSLELDAATNDAGHAAAEEAAVPSDLSRVRQGLACCLRGVMAGAVRFFDIVPVLTLVSLNSAPTAINIQAIATMHGNHEREMAALLFWQYMAAIMALPLLISACMFLLPALGLAAVTSM
ncbi:hypothetical protein WJX81_002947 [Elliptochloris bilobata]|uniref:PIN-like protein n=1 Tax=Elliptochloris bilobata TaxID=381761 RepID=A0AAW1RIC2_9CHLO